MLLKTVQTEIDVHVSFDVNKNKNPTQNVKSLRLPLPSAGWGMPC